MEKRIIYETETATVVTIGDASNRPTIVTFNSYVAEAKAERSLVGFAEQILISAGIPAVHFISRENHWWQIKDLAACLAAARNALAGASHRIGYGSSMGAYGILRFSADLDLDETLAFAPQFTINRLYVPWERRWQVAADQIDFSNETMALSRTAQHHIVYDPSNEDGQHASLIACCNRGANITLHEVEDGGHFILQSFHNHGLLREIVVSLRDGHVDESLLQKHPQYKRRVNLAPAALS